METERPDYKTAVYLYEQLSNGSHRYRSYLLTTTLIRIVLVVLIWSLIISQVIGSPIATAVTIISLIVYAFIEVISAQGRLRAAKYAMKDLKSEIGRKEGYDGF